MKIKSLRIILAGLIATIALSACGQKGPLFHPQPPAPAADPAKQENNVKKPTN